MNELIKIPKILHHVWLGPNQIPDNLKKCLNTCYVDHLSWKHMFWTDDNLPEMNMFRDEYNIDNNYARKSDLVRIAALYQYGGVYLDMDIESIKPIDNLLKGYSFIVATEAGKPDKKNIKETHINNAVIAATKRNKILTKLIIEIKKRYAKITIKPEDHPLTYVADLGGPGVLNYLDNDKQLEGKYNKTYTHEYFYPLHYSDRINGIENWKIPSDPNILDEKTHLIHHFAASWYSQK